MKVRTGLMIGCFVALTFVLAGTASAEPKCAFVRAHLSDYGDGAGLEACGGADLFCEFGRLTGTLNGSFFSSGSWPSDFILFPFGWDTPMIVWRGDAVFQTKHGEIHTKYAGFNYLETHTTGGKATSQNTYLVTGGTGRYEGATGFIYLNYEWIEPHSATGEFTGEICRARD